MQMKKKSSFLRGLCILIGICLLAGGAAVFASWQWGIQASAKQAAVLADTLHSLMPDQQNAVPEERRNNAMPALSLNGKDFIGILEMPRYASALPVCADWGESGKYPCRFSGSIYDGTLQIGGTNQKGQYDFYREISVGDSLFFTDMEGNRYAFAVTDLRYEKHADQAALRREEAALTLFIKNNFAFEYLIVSCDIAD